MFRFKSGTFQFVLLFIYIQNKQKTHERKRTVLYLQPIITQYFIDNKSEIWLLFLIAHSKR